MLQSEGDRRVEELLGAVVLAVDDEEGDTREQAHGLHKRLLDGEILSARPVPASAERDGADAKDLVEDHRLGFWWEDAQVGVSHDQRVIVGPLALRKRGEHGPGPHLCAEGTSGGPSNDDVLQVIIHVRHCPGQSRPAVVVASDAAPRHDVVAGMRIAAAVVDVDESEVGKGVELLARVEDPDLVLKDDLLLASALRAVVGYAGAERVPAGSAVLEVEEELVRAPGEDLEEILGAGVDAVCAPLAQDRHYR
mmetsp:Transcript_72402/g.223677  ORF Transcript_72402/g.223677 Transcript_72402/m.223677 type:complete len:251 (+) Transcript_72402:679-1431(+)